ncbi:hypothetical protein BC829DRAFT_174327 [Chytridium lagenaria]|nr:hypothetical protein BC829DRAFT_174327 [Chytridium lagenaria]
MQSRALEPPFVSSKPSLMSMHSVEESTKFENIGKKRVISLKGEDLDDNPYAEINIEEHWGALDKVEDIKKNKSAVRTLRNRQLKIMSQTAMDLIEQEAGFHRMIGRLSDIVMMDDPFCQTLDLSTGIPEDEMKEFREVVMETVCGSSEF